LAVTHGGRLATLPGSPQEEAFAFEGEQFSLADVLIAGAACGEWSRLVARARRRQAVGLADAGAPRVDPDLTTAQVLKFRREHRLEAAADLRAWLSARNMTETGLLSYARAVAAERAGLVPADGQGPGPADGVAPVAWWPDAVLSGDVARWSTWLEHWVTASRTLAGRGPGAAPVKAVQVAAISVAVRDSGVLDVLGPDPATLAARAEVVARLRATYEAWAAAEVDDSAIDRVIRRKRIDWTWMCYDTASFDSPSAAGEAALCVREDGEALADVAARADVPVVRRSGRWQDLPPPEGPALLAVPPGAVAGPVSCVGRPTLLLLRKAVPPARDDALVREMARADLIQSRLATAAAGRARRAGAW
jgi:hypothetical protein